MRYKRAPQYGGALENQPASLPLVVGICLGSALFVLLVMVSICLVLQRKNRRRSYQGSLKQFLLPKDVKPVISFKTAAGPGGLKKSPSPVQSPDSSILIPDSEHHHWTGGNKENAAPTSMETSQMSTTSTIIEDTKPCDNGKKGELNFALRYSFEKCALQVTIASATNLSSPNQQLLDPYIKLQLLPEKQHKVKSRVVRNTLNPVYDEEFTFYGLNYNQLQSTTLHFAVIAFDRYSRDEILGEVICPLHTVDLADSEKKASLSMELLSRSSKFQNSTHRGEMLVSMCYQPATNKVTAVVLKAKNLPKFDITGLADPYVKVYMLYNGQKMGKKKTHVKKRTLSPVYNESFVFDLPSSDPGSLEEVSFEFVVMDWDRVTKNEVMGRAVVSAASKSSSGRSHWDQVCKNPRRQFAEWHKLRP